MPLTAKGTAILESMCKEYGAKKGEQVFYAARNSGKISGVDSAEPVDIAEKLNAACTKMDSIVGGASSSTSAKIVDAVTAAVRVRK